MVLSSPKVKLQNCILVITSIICTLIIIEVAARFFNEVSPSPVKTIKEHRLSRPAPYLYADYDLNKLWEESTQIGWRTDENYAYLPNDVSGEYINIKNGFRKTVGNPVGAAHRIWMFGGSTMMCQEVPDKYTLPSQFSGLVNNIKGAKFEVINFGASSITIKHQLYRLKTDSDIKKGDIVIFMDGINDVVQTLIYQNPRGTMIQHNREKIEKAGWAARVILYIYSKMEPHSAFVRRFLNPFEPAHMKIEVSDKLLDTLEENYFRAIMQAHEFTTSKGATFYHFLQPNLYALSNHTRYETELLLNHYINEKAAPEAFRLGYPRLARASTRAAEQGINSYNISRASSFENRKTEIYLDGGHVNEVGNALLANELFIRIFQ